MGFTVYLVYSLSGFEILELITYPSSKSSDETLAFFFAGPRSAVGNMSDYRCVSDCNSRGREFDPGPVPYFRGD